jgi:hypothetical protein
MNSEIKTLLPSLINYINSDLFTLSSISSSITLSTQESSSDDKHSWDAVVSYLPLKFYRIIESYPNMITYEAFNKKYARNPKMCAYERYNTTNMWRPLMILNRCPSITKFDFDFIRYYNPQLFSQVLSVLISRVQES